MLIERAYIPNEEDQIILGEMVQKTVASEDYESIPSEEEVISIETSVDKNKGGAYPYFYEVHVRTTQETYHFSCKDRKCSEVENGGWSYSVYEDEDPRLPLKN